MEKTVAGEVLLGSRTSEMEDAERSLQQEERCCRGLVGVGGLRRRRRWSEEADVVSPKVAVLVGDLQRERTTCRWFVGGRSTTQQVAGDEVCRSRKLARR